MSDIKFSEVAWGPTFQLAAIRLVSASIVLVVFSAIMDPANFNFFGAVFGAPIILGILVIIALVSSYIGKATGAEWLGFFALPGLLVAIFGDPLLWIVSKVKPGILPVDGFGFVNRTVLFITKS